MQELLTQKIKICGKAKLNVLTKQSICIGGGEYVDGVWQPNKQGLGMGHVFDVLNDLYGDEFIKY